MRTLKTSSPTKNLDVVSICNPLMDILVNAHESDITQLGLEKGVMQLVHAKEQAAILDYFLSQGQSRIEAQELGGSGLNTIRALALLNLKTGYIGAIGQDSMGTKISERMNSLSIDHHLSLETAHATGTCLVLVTPDSDRTMLTCLGASVHLEPSKINYDLVGSARHLHVCGYLWETQGMKQGIIQSIEAIKNKGGTVSFDAADPWVVERNREDFLSLIRDGIFSIVFANKDELSLLYPNLSYEAAAHEITSRGMTAAAIKLGKDGALLREGKEELYVPAYPTQVVDTTAAGDMFAGGYLYSYLKNDSLAIRGQWATRLAADVISRYGASLSAECIKDILHA